MKLLFSLALILTLASCAGGPPAKPSELVYYPNPPDPPRIQFLRSVSAASDVEPPRSRSVREWLLGDEPEPPRPILRPAGIAQHGGKFFVTDTQFASIYSIDFAGKSLELAVLQGRSRLITPMGISIGADGEFFVADRGRKQVVVLNEDFSWNRELGPWDDDSAPVDVVVDAKRIYVADSGSKCARVIDIQTGKQVLSLGHGEDLAERLRGPTDIAVDEHGNIYVGDVIDSRIYVWDREGKFIRHIGAPGDAPGYFARPKGIAYSDHKIWALDSEFDHCQIFDLSGRVLLAFGGHGPGPGSMHLPRKIWVGKEGLEHFRDALAPGFSAELLVAVTNSYGGKVSFYAVGKSAQFEYPEIRLPTRPTGSGGAGE